MKKTARVNRQKAVFIDFLGSGNFHIRMVDTDKPFKFPDQRSDPKDFTMSMISKKLLPKLINSSFLSKTKYKVFPVSRAASRICAASVGVNSLNTDKFVEKVGVIKTLEGSHYANKYFLAAVVPELNHGFICKV